MTQIVEKRRTFENTYVKRLDPRRMLKELRQMYLVAKAEDWSGAWQYAGNYAILDDEGYIIGTLYSEVIAWPLKHNMGTIVNGVDVSLIPVPRLHRCMVGRKVTIAKALGSRASYNDRLRQNSAEVSAWLNKVLPPPQQ